MNLQPSTTETQGMTAAEHLSVLHYYAPEFRLDVIIADPTVVTQEHKAEFCAAAEKLGATVVFRKVKDEHRANVRDPLRLAVAFSEAFDTIPSYAYAHIPRAARAGRTANTQWHLPQLLKKNSPAYPLRAFLNV